MLCPYRVYSSCQKEGTGENRSRLAYCRAFFGLLIHQNHLRKFDFREKPHFEGFSENRRNRQCENSSKIKKTEKRLGGFAKNDYLCTRWNRGIWSWFFARVQLATNSQIICELLELIIAADYQPLAILKPSKTQHLPSKNRGICEKTRIDCINCWEYGI